MTTYIGLLRGINVGGNKKVSMSDLRQLLVDLGFQDPRTLLQSGNIVFRAPGRNPEELEKQLEEETKKRLGVEADYIVRTSEQLRKVIAENPFADMAEKDPSHLLAMFLKRPISRDLVDSLQSAIQGREVVSWREKELYVTYPDAIGPSKLTGQVIERHLGVRGTARNWNTILKLSNLASPLEGQ